MKDISSSSFQTQLQSSLPKTEVSDSYVDLLSHLSDYVLTLDYIYLVFPHPLVSFSYSSEQATSAIQADSVLLLGMRENPATLRQKLKFMASGMPSKHIGFTLLVSKIFEWKSM